MEKKDKMIQWGYFIGLLLVVFGHSHPLGATYYPKYIHKIIEFIYYFHMPLFFFISGYLSEKSKVTKNYSIESKIWLKKKISKLIYPYILLTILGIFPKIMLSNYTTDKLNMNFIAIIKIIFVPRDSVWGHLWFIPTLLVIIIVGSYSDKIKIRKGIVIILLILLNIFPIYTNWFAFKDISINLIYFILGKYLYEFLNKEENRKKIFSKKYIFLIVILVLILLNFDLKILKLGIILSMIYIILGISYILGKKIKILDIIDNNIFVLYLYGWPFQAVIEIVTNKILHWKWFLIFPSMFLIGLLGPLTLIKIHSIMHIKNERINRILGF
ncbi:acyltransferase family protein [Fusobacterium perfoetens]|uniref:acyltransferase family protein n=1 Tax=Fusobacterium perfoetens TaxID=852 RepID=UPI0026F0E9A2|nr:acyltransferase family protein [Fusobacterium perfoetens]